MTAMKKNRDGGWSLVELATIIAILAVLATIAMPRYMAYVNQGKKAQCISNMYVLERDEYLQYTHLTQPPQPFVREPDMAPVWRTVEMAGSCLVPGSAFAVVAEEGVEKAFHCPSNGVYVVEETPDGEVPFRVICSVHGELRLPAVELVVSGGDSGATGPEFDISMGEGIWNFTKMTSEELDQLTMTSESAWNLVEQGGAQRLEGDGYNQRVYMENDLDEYSLRLVGKLESEKTSSVGYGILFDTDLNVNHDDMDTGFILQFDKGYGDGAIVLRERENGNERSPFAVIDPGKSDDPDSEDYDPFWWNQEHEMELVVSRLDKNTKQVRILIDGVEYGNGEPITYKSRERDGSLAGLRVWGGASTFGLMQISPPGA